MLVTPGSERVNAWLRIACEKTVFSEPTLPCKNKCTFMIICHISGGVDAEKAATLSVIFCNMFGVLLNC